MSRQSVDARKMKIPNPSTPEGDDVFYIEPETPVAFAIWLRKKREERGLSQSDVAKKLGIGEKLYLSRGEEEGGGRNNPSLLADTLEAVIGAYFLDQGMDVVAEFIKKHLLSDISEKISKPLKDAKSRLQELVQSKGYSAPIYKVVEASGPDHNKKFVVEVLVDSQPRGQGKGKNKSSAAQSAAEDALKNI